MKKNFMNTVKMTKPGTNHFDLSHDTKLSLNMGELVPVTWKAAIPGDRFDLGNESLTRFAPLVAPVMHRFNVFFHWYFVPNRILWPNWENYITNTKVGDPTPLLPAHPYVYVGDGMGAWGNTRLDDYLGIPPNGTHATNTFPSTVNAFPHAAYQAIYNEYYRDQNLIDPIDYVLADGDNTGNLALAVLRKRAWEHDLFTACLPEAQKGNAVDIPLGKVVLDPNTTDPSLIRTASSHALVSDGDLEVVSSGGTGELGRDVIGVETPFVLDPNDTLITEATTVNDLRIAVRLQEWLEKSMRAGSRYVENILAFFGVKSSDQRLQRPEYITGSATPVVISEVLNTTGTTELPQGNMAGHGVSVVKGNGGSYFCEEHGIIMCIMSVMPKTAYQDGLEREWLKINSPFDYYWPQFAHVGEVAVQNQELFAHTADATKVGEFGYMPRYYEYRASQNRVAGDFRTTLDTWHAGRIFDDTPTLSQEFIECTVDPRNFAVTDPDVQKLYCHVYNRIHARRPIPKFGEPTF